MSEREKAIDLANRILDRPSHDPDDDLAVLARQLIRAPASGPDPRDAVVAAARSYIAAWDNPAIVWNNQLHKRRVAIREALNQLGR